MRKFAGAPQSKVTMDTRSFEKTQVGFEGGNIEISVVFPRRPKGADHSGSWQSAIHNLDDTGARASQPVLPEQNAERK
jgi:hypothetical protein